MDQGMYLIESPAAVVFVAIGLAGERRGPAIRAEAWLWLRASGGVEAVRIGVADPLLLPKRVDTMEFLLERAEAWATGRVARAGQTLEIGSRRAVPDEEGTHGLVSTLVGLAVDAPQLMRCIEADTLWVDLEEAAEEASALAELFVIRES